MPDASRSQAAGSGRNSLALHLGIVFAVSAWFESRFLWRGLNLMDEGWALHAAMQLHAGGRLYEDVFWVFPPGHLLPAWIAWAIDPPGILLARTLYAGFNVALCVALVLLARRLMPPAYALLAGLLVALAAPISHWYHLLFGYRYLVFAVVALLCLDRRLRTGRSVWMLPAGVLAGTSLCFRLSPGVAVGAALGVGILAASRRWRDWLRDGGWCAAGVLAVVAPVALSLHASVGLERVWSEVFVRPIEMTALQRKPIPEVLFVGWGRPHISITFTALCFRLFLALYAVYGGLLLIRWLRSLRRGGVCEEPLLLAVVLFGAVFTVRAFGRADQPHLDSTLPPAALLIAHAVSASARLPGLRDAGRRSARAGRYAVAMLVLLGWVYLQGSDRFFDPARVMGDTRLASVPGDVRVPVRAAARDIDPVVSAIRRRAAPEQTILVMSHAPMIHVLAQRRGPGHHDVVMPGTFRDRDEERRFLERLQAAPPAVVVWPLEPFDGLWSRGVGRTAPLLHRWILDHYRRVDRHGRFAILVPDEAATARPEAAGG